MQIKNDYTSFQNRTYQEQHTHHIPGWRHAEKKDSKEGEMGAAPEPVKGKSGASKEIAFSRDGDSVVLDSRKIKKTEPEKKTGLLKSLWDALGEDTDKESREAAKSALTAAREGLTAGFLKLRDTFVTGTGNRVLSGIRSLRERLKVGITLGRRRFSSREDGFTTLTYGQSPQGRQNREDTGGDRTLKGTQEEIPAAAVKKSHLNDSYNRLGEYCRLNESLSNYYDHKGRHE